MNIAKEVRIVDHDSAVAITMTNGAVYTHRLEHAHRLDQLQLRNWRIVADGRAVEWPGLNVIVHVPQAEGGAGWEHITPPKPQAPEPVTTAEALKLVAQLIEQDDGADWVKLFKDILPVHWESRPGIEEVRTALKVGHAARSAILSRTVTGKFA